MAGIGMQDALRQHGLQERHPVNGSAITYARRYSLSALVGVVADDDDDGEGAWRRDDDREPPRRNAPEPPRSPSPSAWISPPSPRS